MRIDHCPKCGKSGLKYERYPRNPYANPPLWPTVEQEDENRTHYLIGQKWCPRCKEWVKPVNKPYSVGRGID